MATGAIRHCSSRRDNLFFRTVAVLILATVFLGFARTYYLAGVFRAPLPNLLIHIHGAVFSLWILFLIVQTCPWRITELGQNHDAQRHCAPPPRIRQPLMLARIELH